MGWASGSELAGKLVTVIHSQVKNEKARKAIYCQLIDAFGDHDCDTLDECLGIDPIYDDVMEAKYGRGAE